MTKGQKNYILEKIQGKTRETMIKCCFHDEKTSSLQVNPKKMVYYCFSCGAKGSLEKNLGEFEVYKKNLQEKKEEIFVDFDTLWEKLPNIDQKIKDYILKRGFSWVKFDVKMFDHRLCMPLRNHEKKIQGIQIRAIDDEGHKSRFDAFRGGRYGIFGIEYLENLQDLYICEGFFDMLSLRVMGKNAVGIPGKDTLLRAFDILYLLNKEFMFKNIYFALDRGTKIPKFTREKFEQFFNVFDVEPVEKDWNEDLIKMRGKND